MADRKCQHCKKTEIVLCGVLYHLTEDRTPILPCDASKKEFYSLAA